jgi:arabinogalactan oligomer / maltooligosaccharide transport system substrate-binding protein
MRRQPTPVKVNIKVAATRKGPVTGDAPAMWEAAMGQAPTGSGSRRSRSRLAGCAVATAALAVVTACGDGADNTVSARGTDHPAADRAVDLLVWADERYADALTELAAAFADDKAVTVSVQPRDSGTFVADLQTAALEGNAPDLAVLSAAEGDGLWREGLVDELELDGEVIGDLLPAARASFTADPAGRRAADVDTLPSADHRDATLYGLPVGVEAVALLRNPKLVPEPPSHWTEVEEAALHLRQAGEVTHGLLLPTEPADPHYVHPLVTGRGGYLFGRDADGFLDPNDVGLDKQGHLAAADHVQTMIAAELVSTDIAPGQIGELLASSEAAFAIAGPEVLAALTDTAVDITGINPINNSRPLPYVQTYGLVVTAEADTDLAHRFVDTAATTEWQHNWPRPLP